MNVCDGKLFKKNEKVNQLWNEKEKIVKRKNEKMRG